MEFNFKCPHCDRELAAADNTRGQATVCPACQQALIVPGLTTAASTPTQHDEEIVEVLEEFKPPQAAEPPPLRANP